MTQPTLDELNNLTEGAFHRVDATGLLCPEPVMMLHNFVRTMAAGEIVKVIATDESTLRDIPRFCEFLRHALLHTVTTTAEEYESAEANEYVFWIQKRDD